jgi:hypothetical protein
VSPLTTAAAPRRPNCSIVTHHLSPGPAACASVGWPPGGGNDDVAAAGCRRRYEARSGRPSAPAQRHGHNPAENMPTLMNRASGPALRVALRDSSGLAPAWAVAVEMRASILPSVGSRLVLSLAQVPPGSVRRVGRRL